MKIVGIAQRFTRRATSVGGIVLVEGEEGLARVLERVYAAMRLPFRNEGVGSLRRSATAQPALLSTGGRWRWPAAAATRTWSARRSTFGVPGGVWA